jgi:hypothetical protein
MTMPHPDVASDVESYNALSGDPLVSPFLRHRERVHIIVHPHRQSQLLAQRRRHFDIVPSETM